MLTTTYPVTRSQAKTFIDTKTQVVVKGDYGVNSVTQISGSLELPFALTPSGVAISTKNVNSLFVYLYAKDGSIEDMNVFEVKPSTDVCVTKVNSMVYSSFTEERMVTGTAYSGVSDLLKAAVMLFPVSADLSSVTDEQLKAFAETHSASIPLATLDKTARYESAVFSLVPTVLSDYAGNSVTPIVAFDNEYKIRAIVYDVAGNFAVVKPAAEDNAQYGVVNSISVTIDTATDNNDSIDVTATVTDNNGPAWLETSKYWRVKVLSIHNGTSKVLAGSETAMNPTGTDAQMVNLYELALVETDGVVIIPTDVTLTNSEGTQHTNVAKIQNDSYASSEQGGVYYNFFLKDYINIDYTFSEPKSIAQINIGNGGLNGLPVDMEIYNSRRQHLESSQPFVLSNRRSARLFW